MVTKIDGSGTKQVKPDAAARLATEAAKVPSQQQPTAKDSRDQSVGSFSSMLTEAYDGDTAEQMTHLAHSHAHAAAGEHSEEPIEDVDDRRAPQRIIPVSGEGDAVLDGLRRRKETKVGKAEVQETTSAPAQKSLVDAHEKLMLVSSQMQIPEVASHLSYGAFNRLSNILCSPLWARDPAFLANGLRAQARS